MKMKEKIDVLDFVPRGEAQAISMSKLSQLLGVDERECRAAVHKARLDGAVICGTSRGYYVPENACELLSYYRAARSRALSGLAALKATRKMIATSGGTNFV